MRLCTKKRWLRGCRWGRGAGRHMHEGLRRVGDMPGLGLDVGMSRAMSQAWKLW